jgi:hypothetical protein
LVFSFTFSSCKACDKNKNKDKDKDKDNPVTDRNETDNTPSTPASSGGKTGGLTTGSSTTTASDGDGTGDSTSTSTASSGGKTGGLTTGSSTTTASDGDGTGDSTSTSTAAITLSGGRGDGRGLGESSSAGEGSLGLGGDLIDTGTGDEDLSTEFKNKIKEVLKGDNNKLRARGIENEEINMDIASPFLEAYVSSCGACTFFNGGIGDDDARKANNALFLPLLSVYASRALYARCLYQKYIEKVDVIDDRAKELRDEANEKRDDYTRVSRAPWNGGDLSLRQVVEANVKKMKENGSSINKFYTDCVDRFYAVNEKADRQWKDLIWLADNYEATLTH